MFRCCKPLKPEGNGPTLSGPYFIQLGIAQYSIRVVGTLSTFERKHDEDRRKTAAQSSKKMQWSLGLKWKNQPHFYGPNFLWLDFCFRTILFCSLSTFEGKNEWWKDMKGIWHPKDQSVPPSGLFGLKFWTRQNWRDPLAITCDRHHPGYG